MSGNVQAAARFPVLHLSRSGAIDGLQRQLLYLAAELDRERFPLTIAVDAPGPLQDALAARAIECPVHRMSPWRSLAHVGARYADAYRLLALARARGTRIVHAQDVWRAEYARFIASRLRIPYIVHVRGPLRPRDIRKHRLARADAVITIARRYVDDLVAAGIPAERVTLIDDAVDLHLFASAAAAKPERPAGEPLRIGLVGRISPEKRIREFLAIIALLPAQLRHSTHVSIIGEWMERDYRRTVEDDVTRLRLGDSVAFTGRRESAQMPQALAALDLLVTLSGGSVMFEAMAMATPVLSVRADGRHSEHTRHGETAWCVTTDRPERAAAELAHLLADAPLRKRLADAGRDWVHRHLSTAAMGQETQALYSRLLAP